ncbi:hypothetical protein DMA11_13920 [Marinilabiliaceae bacterium JC017]|nr:hypothetical protein DMA11_13920 [Marinilabiliaceae bacterium JC017]
MINMKFSHEYLNFNILDYRLSHKLLIIRASFLENNELVNIDILFKGVFYIETSTNMDGILIVEGNEADYKRVQKKYGDISNSEKVFKLKSKMGDYLIGALSYEINKNKLPPLKSPFK